jgi:Flp pilus assembly protein TadD
MRKWIWIVGALSISGCEEQTPPPKPAPIVKLETPKLQVAPTPAPIEAKVATSVPKVEAVDQPGDEEKSPIEAITTARQALSSGQLDRALKLAKVGVLKAPERASAWNTLGRVQLQRGERKQAQTSFEKAVELNPNSSWAQNNLGLTLIYAGKYEEAVDALEAATENEPVEAYMWNNLGMAYEHLDRLEEARDAYRKAADLKSERAQDNLARLEGVQSVFRTAKAEVKLPIDVPAVDAGH